MTLRTLKDLNEYTSEFLDGSHQISIIKKDLRKELGIKWAKNRLSSIAEINSMLDSDDFAAPEVSMQQNLRAGLELKLIEKKAELNLIKELFNITEEELK